MFGISEINVATSFLLHNICLVIFHHFFIFTVTYSIKLKPPNFNITIEKEMTIILTNVAGKTEYSHEKNEH